MAARRAAKSLAPWVAPCSTKPSFSMMSRLASATAQEREHAYEVARRELAGLVVLPARTRAAIERGITGEIGR